MEIRFKKIGIERFWRSPLCLTATGQANANQFNRVFVLSVDNLPSFLAQTKELGRYSGKYVFNKKDQTIALCPIGWSSHEDLCKEAFGELGKTDVIAAQCSISFCGNKLFWIVAGLSIHFGKPSPDEQKMVAEHIAGLLRAHGYSPTIDESGLIKTDPI